MFGYYARLDVTFSATFGYGCFHVHNSSTINLRVCNQWAFCTVNLLSISYDEK